MLKRTYRLSARTRLRTPITYNSPLFMVKIAANQYSYNRFGFIVRKTLDKRSTVRNRLRRLFRSCVEEFFDHIVPGYDMLFFLKGGIIGKDRSDVCKEVEKFLIERSLLKKQ